MVDTNQRLQLQVKASSCSLANAKHNKPTKDFSAPPGAEAYPLHQPHFFAVPLRLKSNLKGEFDVLVKQYERGICRSRLRACMVVCADSERALASATDLFVWWRICHSSSSMVVWTRARVCGGAARFPRATQRRVAMTLRSLGALRARRHGRL